jgi:hypothetical protein
MVHLLAQLLDASRRGADRRWLLPARRHAYHHQQQHHLIRKDFIDCQLSSYELESGMNDARYLRE